MLTRKNMGCLLVLQYFNKTSTVFKIPKHWWRPCLMPTVKRGSKIWIFTYFTPSYRNWIASVVWDCWTAQRTNALHFTWIEHTIEPHSAVHSSWGDFFTRMHTYPEQETGPTQNEWPWKIHSKIQLAQVSTTVPHLTKKGQKQPRTAIKSFCKKYRDPGSAAVVAVNLQSLLETNNSRVFVSL